MKTTKSELKELLLIISSDLFSTMLFLKKNLFYKLKGVCKMKKNSLLTAFFLILIIGSVVAQIETCEDISDELETMRRENLVLQDEIRDLKSSLLSFTNNYADNISTQTQQLRNQSESNKRELQSTIIARTNPMLISFPIMLGWIAILSGMAWLFGYVKSRDALIKWYNRKNLLCTCGKYAKFDKKNREWMCGCGKEYKLKEVVVKAPKVVETPIPKPPEKSKKEKEIDDLIEKLKKLRYSDEQ